MKQFLKLINVLSMQVRRLLKKFIRMVNNMIKYPTELNALIKQISEVNSQQYTTLTMNQSMADKIIDETIKYKIIIDESCVSGEVRMS